MLQPPTTDGFLPLLLFAASPSLLGRLRKRFPKKITAQKNRTNCNRKAATEMTAQRGRCSRSQLGCRLLSAAPVPASGKADKPKDKETNPERLDTHVPPLHAHLHTYRGNLLCSPLCLCCCCCRCCRRHRRRDLRKHKTVSQHVSGKRFQRCHLAQLPQLRALPPSSSSSAASSPSSSPLPSSPSEQPPPPQSSCLLPPSQRCSRLGIWAPSSVSPPPPLLTRGCNSSSHLLLLQEGKRRNEEQISQGRRTLASTKRGLMGQRQQQACYYRLPAANCCDRSATSFSEKDKRIHHYYYLNKTDVFIPTQEL